MFQKFCDSQGAAEPQVRAEVGGSSEMMGEKQQHWVTIEMLGCQIPFMLHGGPCTQHGPQSHPKLFIKNVGLHSDVRVPIRTHSHLLAAV